MSIEERLEQIELSASRGKGQSKGASDSLQTDGFAVLLVQGLESKDEKILNVSRRPFINPSHHRHSACFKNKKNKVKYFSVVVSHPLFFKYFFLNVCSQKIFQSRKEAMIKNTVARLPLSAVLPLVEEVSAQVLKTHFPFWFLFLFGFFPPRK